MALPTLDSVFASAADLPRRQMLAKWLVEETETGGNSSVAVSGAGSDAANGTYTYRGDYEGKGYYNLVGEADSTTENVIIWSDEDRWNIHVTSEDTLYTSSSDTEFPWTALWDESNGNLPVPTVTEIPPQSPNIADYWTLPERYLWAKIAVAAGAPRGEADYISLPKNYVWSDIYNAVSGDIANSTVVVSGLSDTQYNGRYVYDGDVDGRPSYRLSVNVRIYWNGSNWDLYDTNTDNYINGAQDVLYPWLVTSWGNQGIDFTGIFLTPQTPNHIDWTEKQALGHIAAAYRGDTANPANLATYINWPWRYQVASIITSLAAPATFNAVIVSGAGIESVNATYVLDGENEGKAKYIYEGNYIEWNGGSWVIYSGEYGEVAYFASDDVEFPWQATLWEDNGDYLPAPTLTPTNV